MERDPSEARFCAECNKRHGAEEGDFWAESSMLGLRITYFAFMDGKVYDITGMTSLPRPLSQVFFFFLADSFCIRPRCESCAWRHTRNVPVKVVRNDAVVPCSHDT